MERTNIKIWKFNVWQFIKRKTHPHKRKSHAQKALLFVSINRFQNVTFQNDCYSLGERNDVCFIVMKQLLKSYFVIVVVVVVFVVAFHN